MKRSALITIGIVLYLLFLPVSLLGLLARVLATAAYRGWYLGNKLSDAINDALTAGDGPEGRRELVSFTIDNTHVAIQRREMTGKELRGVVTPPIGPERDLYLELPGASQDILIADTYIVYLSPGVRLYSSLCKTNG